jgi:hypothetical protein
MDISVFTDNEITPTEASLMEALGENYQLWKIISEYVHIKYPGAVDQWSHSGKKYGWNFRIKDKKRAIVYLLPREGYFKTAFVFGEKATEVVMQSNVSNEIKGELSLARPYVEGRGIRIDVKNEAIVEDIRQLIDIKIGC